MGFRGRLRKLEDAAKREVTILVTEDGEEVVFHGDFRELLVEFYNASREHRPVEHEMLPYLERGSKAKNPERDSTVWGLMSWGSQQYLREPIEDLSE